MVKENKNPACRMQYKLWTPETTGPKEKKQ